MRKNILMNTGFSYSIQVHPREINKNIGEGRHTPPYDLSVLANSPSMMLLKCCDYVVGCVVRSSSLRKWLPPIPRRILAYSAYF